MKILDIDWRDFFEPLARYLTLPQPARRMFVETVQPSQALPNASMGECRQTLLDSGLMIAGVKGVNASVVPRYRVFSKVIRGLSRNRIFEAPSRQSFYWFLRENLADDESAALYGRSNYYYSYDAPAKLFARACTSKWVRQFLAARDITWETQFQIKGAQLYLASSEILNAAQWLIKALANETAPTPLAQIPGLLPELSPALLSDAIRAATRYLLVFPALIGADLVPALGLWPGLAAKLRAKGPRPPEPVSVDQEFCSPFLMEDMTTILSACAVTPLRVRAGDHAIFEADRRDLGAAMGSLPAWIEERFHLEHQRISTAHAFLSEQRFVEVKGDRGRDLSLEASASGVQWLTGSGKDRLKSILDRLRASPEGVMPYGMGKDVGQAILAAYAPLHDIGFVRLDEFMAFRRQTEVPPVNVQIWTEHGYTDQTEDEVEEAWEKMFSDFLLQRLIPLGGVKLGHDGRGAICIALSLAGRYLAGAGPDFDLGEDPLGHILVQPNFDIVFLAPSHKAEIEIARFAERKGRNIGSLFKLTKSSIQTAAAAGLTPERVLATLREHCTAAIPPNVEAEIVGWFRQFRQIGLRKATLIHCPDAETATRVLAAAGKSAARLSDTVLEWTGDKMPPALLKKLRNMGIFVAIKRPGQERPGRM